MKKKTEIIKIECSCCGKIFYKCRRCYRNNRYCSEECKKSGLRESLNMAQKKYRKTEKGKKQHAESEKRRRSRKKTKKNKKTLKKYQSCMCMMMKLVQKFKKKTKAKCQNCGIEGEVVEKFSKRGY
ncbi:hypothetical protein MHK_008398 [Candidatus Magnetomorum sp. HK-1]|nr:hypothetical protein MHK_008398 [Candidatus Magnetomorum sp. HK-1]